MIKKSTWLHLRLPFSFYLMPVYFFALSISHELYILRAAEVFVLLHFFLYPASNAYNSYFDNDEESIGGLEKPPPVSRELYYTAIGLDATAWLAGLFLIGPTFSLMTLIYSLVSRAYSHPCIRLKQYPFGGWLIAGFFQGFFTFCMVYLGVTGTSLPDIVTTPRLYLPALLSSMLLWGSYPMTQVYQHREDSRRGDRTLSLLLGIKGTFYFTAIFFSLANAGFLLYYAHYYSLQEALLFQLFLAPMLAYFFHWLQRTRQNLALANFRHTMRLNIISAFCLNLFFVLFRVWSREL